MRGIVDLLLAATLLSGVGSAAMAGTLVASGDEWQLSNDAYADPYKTGTQQFVTSLAATFGGSNYLFLSGNGNVPGTALTSAAAQFATLGKTVTFSPAFDPLTASSYDAVFHFGQTIDPAAIKNYVDGGGSAYVSLGGGWYGSAAGEAAYWNPTFATFGLVAGGIWFTAPGFVQATVTTGPSTALIWGYGQSIEKLPGSLTSQSYIRGNFGPGTAEVGLVGASQTLRISAVPEPATWAFMMLGFAAVGAGLRSRRSTVSFA